LFVRAAYYFLILLPNSSKNNNVAYLAKNMLEPSYFA